MIGGQVLRQQPDDLLSIPPGPLQNLVCGPVEVEAIDVGSFDDGSGRRQRRLLQCSACVLFREPHARGEVGGQLRLGLVGKRAAADQAAIRDQLVAAARMNSVSTVTVRGSFR